MHIIDVVIKYYDAVVLPKLGDPLPLDERALPLWKAAQSDGSAKLVIRRLFQGVLGEALDELIAMAVQNTCEREHLIYRPPTFENYLWVSVAAADGERETSLKVAVRLVEGFLVNEQVQHAYIRLPDVPAAPPRSPKIPKKPSANFDRHLQSAPNGIGALDVWKAGRKGTRGELQTLVNVEYGWCVNHEALLDARRKPRAEIDIGNTAWMQNKKLWDHGTQVLGVIYGDQPGPGKPMGIAPAVARVEVISTWRDDTLDTRLTTAQAVIVAAANALAAAKRLDMVLSNEKTNAQDLDKNAVILTTLAAELPGQHYFFPVEIYPDTFDAIHLLTSANFTVVEPTGNGRTLPPPGAKAFEGQPAVDFDMLEAYIFEHELMPRQPDGKIHIKSLNPDATGSSENHAGIQYQPFKDSGAIMVAAAQQTVATVAEPAKWVATSYSGRGKRIDCFAQGQDVHTADFNNNAPSTSFYTDHFNGTSSASSIIAGVALVTQSMARPAKNQPLFVPLSSRELRERLRSPKNGTRSGDDERIGVMPNLATVLDTL